MPVKKITAPFYEKLSLVLVGLIALGYLIVVAKDLIDPLIFGFLFAILLLPICSFFEKRLRFHRSIASLLSIITLIAFIGGILYLVGTQISRLADDWPMLKKQVGQSIDDIRGWVENSFHINMDKQMDYVHDATTKLMSSSSSVIGTTLGAVSSLMLFYSFILIFTFLILLYRRLLLHFLVWVFSEENSAIVYDIVENIQSILRKYILGLLLEMVIVATIACTAFLLIGVKYAMLLGLIVGLFNIVPYVGIFTALFLSALITFATGNVRDVLSVIVSVILLHAVDSNVLLPTIVGSKVRLNALISFLGIVIGEMIWGLSGMFLAIPVIAILKIIFDRIESLKPWGFLFGGEYEYKKSAEKAMKTE
ncbi:AI-2E family transporter [Mucilaginibacter sp. McL0603]|uniref:AI-2E family transporter n=1 Tax=Mucilaginibacter sp. McL0603 TaxID=3415670 RepID=UPI003CECDBA2